MLALRNIRTWPSLESTLAKFALVSVIIFSLAFCFGPFATPEISFSPWGDTVFLTGPLLCEISRDGLGGKLALLNWNTFEAIDYNTHIASYYPFYFTRWLEFCSPAAAAQASDLIALFHIGVMFVAMIVLLRTAGVSGIAAVFGAFSAVASFNTVALAVFPTIISATAWMPLAVAGLINILYNRQSLFGGAMLAVGLSAMLAAGPGTNIIAALTFIAVGLGLGVTIPLAQSRDFATILKLGYALLGTAVVVAIVSLGSTVNLYMHLAEIVRWTRTGAVVGGTGPGKLTEILAEQQTWRNLPLLVMPSNVNFAVGSYLFGPVTVLLGMLGAVVGWTNKAVRVFTLVMFAAIILVFLAPSHLLMLWGFVPGIGHVRHLSVLATVMMICLGVLSGAGAQALMTEPGPSPRAKRVVVFGSIATVALCFAAAQDLMVSNFAPSTILKLAIFSVLAVGVVTHLRSQLLRQIGLIGLVVLQAFFIAGTRLLPDGMPAVAKSATWNSLETAIDWIVQRDANPGRLVFHSSIKNGELTYTNAGSLAEYRSIPTFQFYMSPRIFWKFKVETFRFNDFSIYGRLGGKYVLAMNDLDDPALREIHRTDDVRIYQIASPRPLVAVLCLGTPLSTDKIGKSLPGRKPSFDPQLTKSLDMGIKNGLDCSSGAIGDQRAPPAVERDLTQDALRWNLPAGKARVVVLNVPPYAAWKLEVNGRAVPLFNLRDEQTVALLPDELDGQAVLQYSPAGYFFRVWISLSAWLFLLAGTACLAWGRWTSQKNAGTFQEA